MAKRRTSKIKASLSLPEGPNVPSEELVDYTALTFGRKNIGKSTLGSSWPNSLNFQTEPGRRNLPIFMLPHKGEKFTWPNIKEYFEMFAENSNLQTAVIDTVDRLYTLCYNHVCSEWGVEQPSQAGYDSSSLWNAIKTEFEAGIELARSTGKTLHFISHERKSNKEDDERFEPTCPGQCLATMQAICDFVMHYHFMANQRVIAIRCYDNTSWAGCGIDHKFLDPNGTPLEKFALPNDAGEVYSTIEKAFNNELYDISYIPPKTKTKTLDNGKPKRRRRARATR